MALQKQLTTIPIRSSIIDVLMQLVQKTRGSLHNCIMYTAGALLVKLLVFLPPESNDTFLQVLQFVAAADSSSEYIKCPMVMQPILCML